MMDLRLFWDYSTAIIDKIPQNTLQTLNSLFSASKRVIAGGN